MTAILAVSNDFTLMNIFALVLIGAVILGCALALRKPASSKK